ncbi:MAG TPA: FecR family protein [Candidatus Acidoferrales bacterium]|nr:FecR family protein [Candidatus Acidoferrales bacterium]
MPAIFPGPSIHAASRDTAVSVFATSIVGKQVELNGSPMSAGATLFRGDVVRLGENSTAALQFGNSSVLAAPLTELVVEAQSLKLRNGRLQVRVNGKEPFTVSGSFFHLNIAGAEGIAGSAEIRLGGAHAEVSAIAGITELTPAGDVPYKLQPGETATFDESAGQPAAGQSTTNPAAGQVSRLIPQVQIDRASQHIVAEVSSGVFWNDDLRSGPTGRAHITLKDGSQLNLGSDSNLRIVQHDAQAQQTSLDLLMGRVRGRITKLSKPDAKFEIHTPVGVAGLVGTDLSLLVTNDFTELMVFEGTVRFTTLNGQSVTVTAGNKIRISKAGALDGPLPFAAPEAQTAQNLTDITGGANSAPVMAAARPTVPMIITLTGAAAGVGIGVWQGTRPAVSISVP